MPGSFSSGSERVNGIVVVDKPARISSATVVKEVKTVLAAKRVGHTGTLDPMATGVLPLCVGEGTKVAGYLLAVDKEYEGELELGVSTDSHDADGNVTERRDAGGVTEAALAAAVAALVGDGLQVPPMHSALKHRGKRMYELARKGVEVERPPRPVTIHRFDITEAALPRVRFFVHCSKGTYVRSLVRDLGEALGCGAHLTALRRTRSGAFGIERAIPLADVNPETAAQGLVSPADAIAHVPAIVVGPEMFRRVADGLRMRWTEIAPEIPRPEGVFRVLTPDGALLALVSLEDDRLRYARVFTYGLT